MKLDIYHIDAFAKLPFEGNPAAVVPLAEWLGDELMQSIAQQNNLAETAFFVPHETGYQIRWFTPTVEIDLCGHATLASAYVLFNSLRVVSNTVMFTSHSGTELSVSKDNELLTLNFPAQPAVECETPNGLVKSLGVTPNHCLKGEDYIAVFDNQDDVAGIIPDFEGLKELDLRGVMVTASGNDYDFVLRFFAPKVGIPEDSVTGAAFTRLIPYWAERLGKSTLTAKQISSRGGEVWCELKDDRVLISGTARQYLVGTIEI
ncbi:MAG: PhzF family phenazine biosynthesis protein [Gammaproteobacteria bacterium]|jgi:PhzF family phenazine biosynthesis protein